MLRITDVSKTFEPGTVNEKKALSHVSLTLETGDFASIVGSNGAGKSTLFNAVAGTFYPDEGTIELDGENITFVKEHVRSQYIGRLFQDPLMGTAPHMTIEENLMVAYLRAHGKKKGIFSRTTKKDREFFREQAEGIFGQVNVFYEASKFSLTGVGEMNLSFASFCSSTSNIMDVLLEVKTPVSAQQVQALADTFSSMKGMVTVSLVATDASSFGTLSREELNNLAFRGDIPNGVIRGQDGSYTVDWQED
jgi:ABC-type branched-subunit amino acid transport system ATPase component